MKKKFRIQTLILLTLICMSNISFSQQSTDISAKIANIKKLYKDIKSKEKTLKVTEISKEDDEGFETFTQIYKSGNETKLIINSVSGIGDCGESYEYYYHQSEVFFILFTSSCYVGDKIYKTEKRYYFDGNELIQFLDGKKNIKPDTQEFKGEEAALIELISEMRIFSK